MLGKVFLGILAIFLLLGAFASPINSGIKGWRTDNTTNNFVVTTAAGVTTANVTLTANLYQNSISDVAWISSNITEVPVATSYTAASNKLLVSALTAGTVRSLTVNYYGDVDSELMSAIGPFLSFLIIGGLIAAVVISIFWKRRRT